jgi:predicted alpha/beta superfamily hydrolase
MNFFKFYILFLMVIKISAVEIIVNVPFHTPTESRIYITGDANLGCQWQAQCHELKAISSSSYKVHLPQVKENFSFKITRGSWQTEAAFPSSRPLPNLIRINNQKQIIFSVAHWKDFAPQKVVGYLESHLIESKIFGEKRRVQLWSSRPFEEIMKFDDVLFFHDGQNAFDHKTATFGNEWNLDEQILKFLEKTNQDHNILVVAIDSPRKRNQEFDILQNGRRYLQFLTEDVLDFLTTNFKEKLPQKAYATMGSSWGAYISFALINEYPHYFSRASMLSFPAFGANYSPFRYLESLTQFDKSISFFLDCGTFQGDQNYPAWLTLFTQELLKKGLNKSHFQSRIYPFHGHSELDWSRRLQDHLDFLFKK